MLALSRRKGERIKIGSDITLHMLGQHGTQIYIDIEASKSIPIHRGENYETYKKIAGEENNISSESIERT